MMMMMVMIFFLSKWHHLFPFWHNCFRRWSFHCRGLFPASSIPLSNCMSPAVVCEPRHKSGTEELCFRYSTFAALCSQIILFRTCSCNNISNTDFIFLSFCMVANRWSILIVVANVLQTFKSIGRTAQRKNVAHMAISKKTIADPQEHCAHSFVTYISLLRLRWCLMSHVLDKHTRP